MDLFQTLDYTVYPSSEPTITVKLDNKYGGAHEYYLKRSLGYNNGKTDYIEDETIIRFVQKDENGDVHPGIQDEQLIYVLMDRLEKLNAIYPHETYKTKRMALELFLGACEERIDDRINRKVMGKLEV